MPEKEETRIAPRPATPSPAGTNNGGVRPYELDPELAQIKLAELMIQKLETPSIISQSFCVRNGIFTSLNHRPPLYRLSQDGKEDVMIDPGNNTGYDCSLRLDLYHAVESRSVNIDGKYFHNFWAYLMKPKYIINATSGQTNQINQEEGPSMFDRVKGWFGGKKKSDPAGGSQ